MVTSKGVGMFYMQCQLGLQEGVAISFMHIAHSVLRWKTTACRGNAPRFPACELAHAQGTDCYPGGEGAGEKEVGPTLSASAKPNWPR